jgi:hypothetical protein
MVDRLIPVAYASKRSTYVVEPSFERLAPALVLQQVRVAVDRGGYAQAAGTPGYG